MEVMVSQILDIGLSFCFSTLFKYIFFFKILTLSIYIRPENACTATTYISMAMQYMYGHSTPMLLHSFASQLPDTEIGILKYVLT